jgi:hypothetical protein
MCYPIEAAHFVNTLEQWFNQRSCVILLNSLFCHTGFEVTWSVQLMCYPIGALSSFATLVLEHGLNQLPNPLIQLIRHTLFWEHSFNQLYVLACIEAAQVSPATPPCGRGSPCPVLFLVCGICLFLILPAATQLFCSYYCCC